MIIAVIAEKTWSSLSEAVRSLPPEVDGVELRLDCLAPCELKNDIHQLESLMVSRPCPVILTLRPPDQGGYYVGDEQQRLDQLHRFASLKPDYIDIESYVDPAFIRQLKAEQPAVQIIRSYHHLSETPRDLEGIWSSMQHPEVSHYKLVTHAQNALDNLRMLHFLKKQANGKLTAHCMGHEGLLSRLLGVILGNCFYYVSVCEGRDVGQASLPSLSDSLSIYRVKHINAATCVFALLGDPVVNSIGHLFHNNHFAENGLNALYAKIRLRDNEVADFLKHIADLPLKGFSVTRPLKEKVMPYLDETDACCKAVGASNTLLCKDNRLYGLNTDGPGAVNAIKRQSQIKDSHVLLIGAGGSAKAIAYAIQQEKPRSLSILNRTFSKTVELAHCVQANPYSYEDFGLSSSLLPYFDNIINTVPHDVNSDRLLFKLIQPYILPDTVFMSIDYADAEAILLREVRAAGCKLVDGKQMFLEQAMLQFSHFRLLTNTTAL